MATNNSLYKNTNGPQSNILKSTFVSRLSSLFGFHTASDKAKSQSNFSKKYGLEFVRVDLDNSAYRIKNAALGSIYDSHNLSDNLEKYFDAYTGENSTSYSDIQDRQARLNELSFMCYNDAFISRCVKLVADEATQLDVQDRILSIESPNTNFVNRCYELFAQWGITQQRIEGVCYDLELYGESFWVHKIGMNGVEKIVPIRPNTIQERLEFSPVHMAEYLSQRDGYWDSNKDRKGKIEKLVDLLKSESAIKNSEDLADMFDNKLLGYELHDGIIAPPWTITHFRYCAENSEFYPYGRPPLIHCLAPFKQSYSNLMLQGLARTMSFPVQIYKVHTTEGFGPGTQFDHVNEVREEYDNIGVSASSSGSEVYTVNTKIWVPDGLLDFDTKDSKVDFDFTGDLEMYQDKVAIAAGVPKAYLDQEFGGFGNSGISLTEQYKPFARHVYTIQASFIQGLGELIRLHFAITGEFDYNTPFVISMRFPAEEMGQEKRDARSASIELVNGIVDLLKGSLGLSDEDQLPEDVIVDILSKYSFLDPTDITKWTKLSSFLKPAGGSSDDKSGGDDDGGMDLGGGGLSGGGPDLGGGDDTSGDEAPADTGGEEAGPPPPTEEGRKYTSAQAKKMLRERKRFLMNETSKKYSKIKDDLYFHFLEHENMTEFQDTTSKRHKIMIPKIGPNDPIWESVQIVKKDSPFEKLSESQMKDTDKLNNMLEDIKKSQKMTKEEDAKQQELYSKVDKIVESL